MFPHHQEAAGEGPWSCGLGMWKIAPNISASPIGGGTCALHPWVWAGPTTALTTRTWRLTAPGTEKADHFQLLCLETQADHKMSRVERGHMEKTQRTRCHMETEATWSSTDGPAPPEGKDTRNPKRDSWGTSQLNSSQLMELWNTTKGLLLKPLRVGVLFKAKIDHQNTT